MAEAKSHTMLYIGLAAIAGIGIYAYMQSTQKPWTLPANAAQVAAITNWINQTSNPTGWLNYFKNTTAQSDLDNMNALITQYWAINAPPVGALETFFMQLNAAVNP